MTAPALAVRSPGAAPVRPHAWVPLSDRRIYCPHGHVFTPREQLLRGTSVIRCPFAAAGAGQQTCGAQIYVMTIPDCPHRFQALVTDEDGSLVEPLPDVAGESIERGTIHALNEPAPTLLTRMAELG